jgi:lipopolysaccharide export system protein LptA
MNRQKRKLCTASAGLTVMALFAAAPVAAQTQNTPGPFVMSDPKEIEPAQIEAARLEVSDKNKMATFSGNVQVVQGDSTIKCQSLVVYYGPEISIGPDGTPAATPPKATPGVPKSADNIRRIEMLGGVTVLTKDQNAHGDLGIYDPQAKTITLSGNVAVRPKKTGDQ